MEIGRYQTVTDWPKMGPSLLIATCLIVAIRTARWSATHDAMTTNIDLNKQTEHAARVAHRVLSTLIAKYPSILPQAKRPCTSHGGGSSGVTKSMPLESR
jgi:hypothetical protein